MDDTKKNASIRPSKRFSLNPQQVLRVISNSTTFYPVDSRNEEGLTMINSIAYMQQNFGEIVNTFTTNDQIVVLQMWHGLLFQINSENNLTNEFLRFILLVVKDIAVFLFGKSFENHMAKNIKNALREIYAKYIDTFFRLCNEDYKTSLMIYDADIHTEFQMNTQKSLLADPKIIGSPFVECILFYNHQIWATFTGICSKPLDTHDMFFISLFEKVENEEKDFSEPNQLEDPADLDQIVHKSANIFIDGNIIPCLVSQIQLGPKSPFILIFITKEIIPTPEIKENLFLISQVISSQMKLKLLPPSPRTRVTFQVTSLIHYIIINRSTGEFFESPHIDTPKNDPNIQDRLELFESIKTKLISFGIQSLLTGSLAAIKNEMIFQYIYEFKFIKSHQAIIPNRKFIPPQFDDNSDFSYNSIIQGMGYDPNEVQGIEIYTAYFGVVNAKSVINANMLLLSKLNIIK